ncbi:GNAT family N-acetyltransferase [Lyngbya aestuarii]
MAACAGLRKVGEEVCEIERIYVRPEYCHQGIGRFLLATLIKKARQI